MCAAGQGHERVVELLMQHGAEVNLQDSDGGTALMVAASTGHERVVELLIRHGAEMAGGADAVGAAGAVGVGGHGTRGVALVARSWFTYRT